MALDRNREAAAEPLFDIRQRIPQITLPAGHRTVPGPIPELCTVTARAGIEKGKHFFTGPEDEKVDLLAVVMIGIKDRFFMGEDVGVDHHIRLSDRRLGVSRLPGAGEKK